MTEPVRPAEYVQTKAIPFRKRTTWERLGWLAKKLDAEGEDPIMRFAVASALKAMAIELEFAQSDGDDRGR